jgi:hypothetical protein
MQYMEHEFDGTKFSFGGGFIKCKVLFVEGD